ncbi:MULTISPECIES: NAD-dependent epimerase/dehydratase family protein [Rugamonas]|uniref:Nucleoside-diphosphate-sugar epimerase n=1 Tax=Rugamonas rubra TaxID=758825 RepID=A0A1I4SFA4_9BURK|nr:MULTISPECIES: NAD-dependent epimerase/dehydratase family protein [Rugamonas]WGG52613.1 hypothetical protein QC826_10980 [Rugamonas sp. DEMB1]SFM63010.1 Nucleoside-diphosphate-sugar epimerase [Rugamonas rubra]
MSKNVLIIGGTRYFGKLLVGRLLAQGHRVTLATRGVARDDFGERVQRITVNRRDLACMQLAFADVAFFDVVFDQICYSPLDAAISAQVFAGKVGRYVMASTIEVYEILHAQASGSYREDELDLNKVQVDMTIPWHSAELSDDHYGEGKRQAEAFLYQDGRLPVVSVRIAHVLGGPEDFTRRLEFYVQRVLAQEPMRHSVGAGPSSFVDAEGIAEFLCWVGAQDFLGPVNAACGGDMSALDVYERVAAVLDKPSRPIAMPGAHAVCELSPFDYTRPHAMDTRRAQALGYRFADNAAYLDGLIRRHGANDVEQERQP